MPRAEPHHGARRAKWGSIGLMLIAALVVISHFALPISATRASPFVEFLSTY